MERTDDSTQQLGESWVDLCSQQPGDRITPLPFGSVHNSEVQKLLWEAQRESNQSSARVSRASSRRDTPKSPPNSPNTEPVSLDELKEYYINYSKDETSPTPPAATSDWIWDWSSRPDQHPPKEWKFEHPARRGRLSVRNSKAVKRGLLTSEVLSIVMLTNLVSLLLGAGIGFYIGKRLTTMSNFALD